MAVGIRVGLWVPMILVAVLLVAGANAQQDPSGKPSEDPVLHLADSGTGDGSYHNFTTRPPESHNPEHVEPCQVRQEGTAKWCWQVNRSPSSWTLEAGSRAQAVIHLGRLERVPMGTLEPDAPAETGKLRLDVILTKGTAKEVARAHAYIDPPLFTGDKTAVVHLELPVTQDTHWNNAPGDAPSVELQVELSGMVRRDHPPTVTTGSKLTDSYIVLPGFPLAAFTQWELDEQEQAACRQRLLTQTSCQDSDDTGTDLQGEVHEAGAAGGILIVTATILYFARSRCRPRYGSDPRPRAPRPLIATGP